MWSNAVARLKLQQQHTQCQVQTGVWTATTASKQARATETPTIRGNDHTRTHKHMLAYMGWLCNDGEAHRRGRGEAQFAQIGRIVGAWWSATGWCSASKMSDRRGGAAGGGVARSLSHAHDITPMNSRAASYLINRQHAAALDSAISQFPAVPSTEPVCLPTYVCWSHPRPLTVLFRCCQREIKG